VPEVLMHYRSHPDVLSVDRLKQKHGTLFVWKHIIALNSQAGFPMI
jgi:hypothetical protein